MFTRIKISIGSDLCELFLSMIKKKLFLLWLGVIKAYIFEYFKSSKFQINNKIIKLTSYSSSNMIKLRNKHPQTILSFRRRTQIIIFEGNSPFYKLNNFIRPLFGHLCSKSIFCQNQSKFPVENVYYWDLISKIIFKEVNNKTSYPGTSLGYNQVIRATSEWLEFVSLKRKH